MDSKFIHGMSGSGFKPSAVSRQPSASLREITQEFEAILVSSLLKDAQPSGQTGLFGGGVSRDLYRQLFIDEVAKTIARSGGIGIGKMLERQLQTTLNVADHKNRLKEPPQPADVTDKSSTPSKAAR